MEHILNFLNSAKRYASSEGIKSPQRVSSSNGNVLHRIRFLLPKGSTVSRQNAADQGPLQHCACVPECGAAQRSLLWTGLLTCCLPAY